MKRWTFSFTVALLLIASVTTTAQEQSKYPAPRFPSYLKPPKAIENLMPFARGGAPDQWAHAARPGRERHGDVDGDRRESRSDGHAGDQTAYEERGVKV